MCIDIWSWGEYSEYAQVWASFSDVYIYTCVYIYTYIPAAVHIHIWMWGEYSECAGVWDSFIQDEYTYSSKYPRIFTNTQILRYYFLIFSDNADTQILAYFNKHAGTQIPFVQTHRYSNTYS